MLAFPLAFALEKTIMYQDLQAVQAQWDALVVGAGPAGCVAALGLARRGFGVLLVDRARFPRYKVCGCCLNPNALAELNLLGLGTLLDRVPREPLYFFILGHRSRRTRFELPTGAAVSRQDLDAALAAEAEYCGVTFLQATSALLLDSQGGVNQLRLRQGKDSAVIRARLVVCADGLGGTSLQSSAYRRSETAGSLIGAGCQLEDDTGFEAGTVFMAVGSGGYTGVVRLRDGKLNVAAALDQDSLRQAGGPASLAKRLLAGAGFPVPPALTSVPWSGTRALSSHRMRVAGPGLLIVGDSAGYLEPFTGEGIAWALNSGRMVIPYAEAILDGSHPTAARLWQAAYPDQQKRMQRLCRLVSSLLKRPGLTHSVLCCLHRFPSLLKPLLRLLYSRSALKHTGEGPRR